ncbi:MAG: hypothetical protein A07HR67_01625 [uncultured archaeon A07HR67]|nr:MAG: hypothetical protein A07HR67_01625 [uncultured archaeon A07HR67]
MFLSSEVGFLGALGLIAIFSVFLIPMMWIVWKSVNSEPKTATAHMRDWEEIT